MPALSRRARSLSEMWLRGFSLTCPPALTNDCGGLDAAAALASARGEPMAAAPPVEGAAAVRNALGDFAFEIDLYRRLWRGTQHSSLLASTPNFFYSTLTCHTTQIGIAEHQNSRAEISRKIRLQLWAGCAPRGGVRAAAAPAGARGEPRAAPPPVEGAAWGGMRSAT